MAGCCAVPEKPQSNDWRCPECGRKGKPVPRITLERLLTPEAQQRLTLAAHLFCETPDCPVVYFAPDDGSVFHKPDLTVRVGIKETEPPIPLCYCFGFTREMLWSELAQMGKTTIPDRIKAEVQVGNCRCEETNPRGNCCLGDIQRAIQAFRSQPVPTAELVGVAAEDCCAPMDDCCAVPSEKTQPTALQQVRTERLSILASIGAMLAGLLTSACCWLPALLAAVGVGSAGLGAKFVPYRPFFAIGALALIGIAFAVTYRRQPKEACCLTPTHKAQRFGLWAALVIVLASLGFPTVMERFARSTSSVSSAAMPEGVRAFSFRIEGMSCPSCALAIAANLKRLPNVVDARVDFEKGEATIFYRNKLPSKDAIAQTVASVEGRAIFPKGR
jgi:copper chaperone CopZ